MYFKTKKANKKYIEIKPNGNEKILVLAPHVDDETIGAGGTILKYGEKGSKKGLVYLTDGSGSTSHKSKEETIKERMEEGLQIKDSYGFESVYFLEEVDGFLNSEENFLIEKLKEILLKEKPDIVFSPFVIEGNRDHLETTKALSRALDSLDKEINIYLYQVNSVIFPELINGVSFLDKNTYIKKNNKYSIFKSQWAMGFSVFNLLDRGRALNYNNSYAVEGFVITTSSKLRQMVKKLEDNGFNPYDYKQISSEFTLIKAMIKSIKEKKFYSDLIKDIILKNNK